VKDEDDMHPMGRLAKENWACTQKCLWHKQAIRIGIFPTGDIILQNCDGVYPVVGNYNQPFNKVFENAVLARNIGCLNGCRNINDILKEKGILPK